MRVTQLKLRIKISALRKQAHPFRYVYVCIPILQLVVSQNGIDASSLIDF